MVRIASEEQVEAGVEMEHEAEETGEDFDEVDTVIAAVLVGLKFVFVEFGARLPVEPPRVRGDAPVWTRFCRTRSQFLPKRAQCFRMKSLPASVSRFHLLVQRMTSYFVIQLFRAVCGDL